jgi:hypothetical protein
LEIAGRRRATGRLYRENLRRFPTVSLNFLKPDGNLAAGSCLFPQVDGLSMEGKMKDWTNARLCDVANLVLGAFLFLSPWIFGFRGSTAAENANIAGVIIVVLAIAALAAFAVWEEWLNLIVGLWTLVSPWVLGFQGNTKAMAVCVIVGILVAILAAVEIWMQSHTPPWLSAGR